MKYLITQLTNRNTNIKVGDLVVNHNRGDAPALVINEDKKPNGISSFTVFYLHNKEMDCHTNEWLTRMPEGSRLEITQD